MKSLIDMKSSRGSILILTIWMIALLSFFTLAVGYAVRQKLKVVENIENRNELRLAAEAGVKAAMAVLDRKDESTPIFFDALNQDWSRNPAELEKGALGKAFYSVRKGPVIETETVEMPETDMFGVVDEESKLNIALQNSPVALKRLVQMVLDLDQEESTALAESIIDWQDNDDHTFSSGAERKYYERLKPSYIPKDQPVEVLEELLWVKGMSPEILDALRPYVTVHGSGNLNINTASEPVLYAVGIPEHLVDLIISFRQGADQEDGTEDDGVFSQESTIVSTLDSFTTLSEDDKNFMTQMVQTGQLRVSSAYFRIRTEAYLPNKSMRFAVECIYERYGRIVFWHESFI